MNMLECTCENSYTKALQKKIRTLHGPINNIFSIHLPMISLIYYVTESTQVYNLALNIQVVFLNTVFIPVDIFTSTMLINSIYEDHLVAIKISSSQKLYLNYLGVTTT